MLSEAGRILTASLAAAALAVAGCGSKSKTTSTTKRSAASSVGAAKPASYHAGEFCTPKNAVLYKAQGFKCVRVGRTHRLKKS